jgi:hypothetical protein
MAERVVDLVRARVRQILALEPHVGAPRRAQVAGVGERRRPADPGAQLVVEGALELRRRQDVAHAGVEALQRRDQRLRDVAPAERTIAPAAVGQFPCEQRCEQGFAVKYLVLDRTHHPSP